MVKESVNNSHTTKQGVLIAILKVVTHLVIFCVSSSNLLCLILGEVELAGGVGFFYSFIKWRSGNKMTYWENCNNSEGSRRLDDPTRWC